MSKQKQKVRFQTAFESREAWDEAIALLRPTDTDRVYPCLHCDKMRTKDEGGTVFSVCDECWDKYPPGRRT
jgi:hypothetical protein